MRQQSIKTREKIEIDWQKLIQSEVYNPQDLTKVIRAKTAVELEKTTVEGSDRHFQVKEPLFDTAEIEREIHAYNRRLFDIEVNIKRIEFIPLSNKDEIQNDIEILEKNLKNKYFNSNLTPSKNDSKNQINVNDFFQGLSLITRFRVREEKYQKRERKKQERLSTLFKIATDGIRDNQIESTKRRIRQISLEVTALTNQHEKAKFENKLAELKTVFRKKEAEDKRKRLQIEIWKEAEENLKRDAAKAKIIRKKEQERRLQEKKQKEEKSKIEGERQFLQSLLRKKTNAGEFAEILRNNQIDTLYHFTDKSNLAYIKKYGGLYSWSYLRKKDYDVPYQGGSPLSKNLDQRYGLQDFVRVSFSENHPMLYVATREGRIHEPVVLKIKIDICFFHNTKFANMNATRTGHSCGCNLQDLRKIRFDIAKQPNHFGLSEEEKPYYQAEVLVKSWIPIQFISNIENPIRK